MRVNVNYKEPKCSRCGSTDSEITYYLEHPVRRCRNCWHEDENAKRAAEEMHSRVWADDSDTEPRKF